MADKEEPKPFAKFDKKTKWGKEVLMLALDRHAPLFISTPERMRQVLKEHTQSISMKALAEQAGIPVQTVEQLLQKGYAPLIATMEVLDTLNVEVSAYPPECLTAK